MSNMLQAIVPKSDQLNSDDLIGRSLTIKVTKVSILAGEQPVSIHYEGDAGKPYKPCKSMCRVLVDAWGADANQYVGRSMTLFRDEKVTWAGLAVGGIRISHLSHIEKEKTMVLTATKQTRKPFTVKPLATAPQADTALVSAGKAAAAKGVTEYTSWLSTLAPDAKASIKQYHKGWSDTAKAVVENHKGFDKQGDIPETNEQEVSI